MRSLWFRGITLGAAVLLALVMLFVNTVYEAAGSVSDIEGCSFLAGNLVALLALFPLAAGAVAARAARALAPRFPAEERRIVRCGGRIGFLGASLYLLVGIALTLASATPPLVWGLGLLYSLLAATGGRAGAFLALERLRPLPLQDRN